MLIRKRKLNKGYKGFSLVESLVGVFIAGTAFLAFLTILPKVMTSETMARKSIIATNLAQEGVEKVRNLRDNNLKNLHNAFDDDESYAGNNSTFNPAKYNTSNLNNYFGNCSGEGAMTACKDGNKCLIICEGTWVFSAFDAMTSNGFTRIIYMSGSGDTRTVQSIVSWKIAGVSPNPSVEVDDTLTAWGQ